MTIEQNPVYTGETVTLRCSAGPSSDWRYTWFRSYSETATGSEVVNSSRHTISGDTLTISEATHSDWGYYKCYGHLSPALVNTLRSAASYLTVKVVPTATVIRSSPPGAVYPGDTVTLQCDISEDEDWSYKWFRDGKLLILERKKILILSADAVTSYTCVGEMRDRPVKSQSTIYYIVLTAEKPGANLMSGKTSVFTGDTVTLTCSVGESSGWRFYWYRHSTGSDPVSESTEGLYTLTPSSVSEGGEFWCRGGGGNPVYHTEYSQPISINVTVVSSFLQRRLLCGVLVASPFLLATILLVMIHHQRPAKYPAEEQPDYDDVVEY